MKIVFGNYKKELDKLLNKKNRIFVVCGKNLSPKVKQELAEYDIVVFSDFTPNPDIKDVNKAVSEYRDGEYDVIISIGGGSSMDVAKCIKQNAKNVFLISVPTTAGSGSECTASAVIYENGIKISVSGENMLSDYVIEDADFLKTLPEYHRKASMMDALCQSIESFWSKNSNEESRKYAAESMEIILDCYKQYLSGDENAAVQMMKAAMLSGKAINITKTTLPHALSYGITMNCKTAHGHSVAFVLGKVWKYMFMHQNDEIKESFQGLNQIFECTTTEETVIKYNTIYESLKLEEPDVHPHMEKILKSINPERMNNNPVQMSIKEIEQMF